MQECTEVPHDEFQKVMDRLFSLLDQESATKMLPLLSGATKRALHQFQSTSAKSGSRKAGLWGLQPRDKCSWVTEESLAVPIWILIPLIGFLTFCHLFYNGGFIFGDLSVLQTHLKDLLPLNSSVISSGWDSQLQEHGLLTVLTYRLNFLLHGLTASGYYITNLMLHAAVSVLVYYVAQLLFGTDKMTSIWAALLFVVHPIHTEAVSFVSARGYILQALFFELSFLAYSRACSKQVVAWVAWYMVSLAFCIASTLCGGMGATVLIINGLYDIMYSFSTRLDKKRPYRRQLYNSQPVMWRIIGMLYVGCVICALFYFLAQPEDSLLQLSATDNFVRYSALKGSTFFLQRWWSLLYVAGAYLFLLISPTNLSVDHSIHCSPLSGEGFLSDIYLLLVPLAAAGSVIYLYAIEKGTQEGSKDEPRSSSSSTTTSSSPMPSSSTSSSSSSFSSTLSQRASSSLLAISPSGWKLLLVAAWLLVPLAIASNWVWYTPFLLTERAAYLPSIGFCMLLSWTLWALHRSLGKAGSRRNMWMQKGVLIVCIALVAFYAVGTIRYSQTWASGEETLLSATAQQCGGNSTVVALRRGRLAEEQGSWRKAVSHYTTALSQDPTLSIAVERLSKASILDGNYTQALRIMSPLISAYPAVYHLSIFHDAGVCFLELKEFERAVKFLRYVVDTGDKGSSYVTHAHSNLAIALVHLRRFTEALSHAQRAISSFHNQTATTSTIPTTTNLPTPTPTSSYLPAYKNNYGVILALFKRLPQALEEFEFAVSHGHREGKLNKLEVEQKQANPSHSLSLEFSTIIQP